jgi:hypothetical protein
MIQTPNVLGAVAGGMQLREQADQMERRNALAGAVQQFGAASPQARNAFNAFAPEQAVASQMLDLPGQGRVMAGVMEQVLRADPTQRPAIYAAGVQQARGMGVDLDGLPDAYPGDEAAGMLYDLAGKIAGVSAQEATEFERMLAVLQPEVAQQAMLIKLGLVPGADATLRAGAETRGPTFRPATTDEAAAYGAQAGQIDAKTGRFYPADVPQGMTIESDGAGGFRMVQGPATGQPQKPFTEGQSKDVVFATRAEGALAALEPIAENLASIGDRALDMDPTGVLRGNFQTPDYQMARQAGDEFLQAILRKDTGAAITTQEQQLYGVTYLPQPGDSPEVLGYKRDARARAVRALRAGMSPAQIIAVEKGGNPAGDAAPAAPAAAPPEPGRSPVDPSTLSDEELLQLLGGQ